MLPGGAMLFIKRLHAEAPGKPAMMPDGRPETVAYVDPIPDMPSYMRRVVPPKFGDWINGEVLARTGRAMLMVAAGDAAEAQPIVSDDALVQLVAYFAGDPTTVYLVDWRPGASVEAANYSIDGGKVVSVEAVELPDAVRDELVKLRYSKPIHHAVWIKAMTRSAKTIVLKSKADGKTSKIVVSR